MEPDNSDDQIDEYNSEDFVSLPWYSTETSFSRDPIELDHSYGYDCSTNSNLCVVDRNTLIWQTGNIIHVFDVPNNCLSFRRSALGQDISCIAINRGAPGEFAVGENGHSVGVGFSSPMIIIYNWPGFAVRSVLKGGAARCYKSLDFSCDGTKIVSQAGFPDYSLTVWDVARRKIIYVVQNSNFLVNKAVFSPLDPNAFLTCGQGHVKFWRLIETFTGLKIEGLPGRFKNIENDDVRALYILDDARVVTNISKGNLAVWRPNAMLELEFSMKNCQPCHNDLVTFIKIYFKDSHVVTAGLDGYIRVWNYSYISSFFNNEHLDSVHAVIEPSYERRIKDTSGNLAIPVQLLPRDDEGEPYLFYVQDRNGGIWLLDLELKKNPKPWEMLYVCHSGPILDMSTSPAEYYFATVGEGGKVNVYNHLKKTLVATKHFDDVGTSVLWLPFNVETSGRGIVVGFKSGILRVHILQEFSLQPDKQELIAVQTIRPHASAITCLLVHQDGSILLSGSEDESIFIYSFKKEKLYVFLEPIGMVCMAGPVCHLAWNHFIPDRTIAMATCSNGKSIEVILSPENLQNTVRKSPENRATYVLDIPQAVTFAQLNNDEQRVKFSYYIDRDTIWIEGHVHGLYKVGGDRIGNLKIAGNERVHCLIDIDNQEDGAVQFMGLSGGKIRAVKKYKTNNDDVSDYWEIVMHKTENCTVTKLSLSHDNRFLFSCATDSAIFAYKINDLPIRKYQCFPKVDKIHQRFGVENVPELSLEDEKIAKRKGDIRKKHKVKVDEYRSEVRGFIKEYHVLVMMNKVLPKRLRIPKSFLRLETDNERKIEKLAMTAQEDVMISPLKKTYQDLSAKLDKIESNIINLIQTPKFYLFSVRLPFYLKSFPEKKLFTKNPMEEEYLTNDEFNVEDWNRMIKERPGDQFTEFERLLIKVLNKLERNRKNEYYSGLNEPEEEPIVRKECNREEPADEIIPDFITAAGQFLCKHGQFTVAEQQLFQKIDKNRLLRQKCRKKVDMLDKIKTENKIVTKNAIFCEKLKVLSKYEEELPTLTEKLYDLLNTREQIYFKKENFNKKLKELRSEKLELINGYYWAQQEMQYIVEDIATWKLQDSDSFKTLKPLRVTFDLEFPEIIEFEPGPCPESIAERMELYKNQLSDIGRVAPIGLLKMQDASQWRLFPMFKKRHEMFLNGAVALRKTLERSVEEFDIKFRPLSLERSKTSLSVSELKAEYNSILQEVDILYRYKTAQRSIVDSRANTIRFMHVQVLRENINLKKLNVLYNQRKECHRTIDDLNAKFSMMIKDDSDWTPYLKELYFERGELTIDSSESPRSPEIGSPRSPQDYRLMGFALMPPDIDKEQLQQTVKLCEQRRAEELRLLEIAQSQESIRLDQTLIRKKIKICDALLALFFASITRYKERMKRELDEVKYVVELSPSQVQVFAKDDLSNNAPPMEDCKLSEREDYLTKVQTLNDMNSVLAEMAGLVEKTHRNSKVLLKEMEILAEHDLLAGGEIQKLLWEKYGVELDVSELQTYVLTEIIKKVLNRCAENFKTNDKIEREKVIKSDVEMFKYEALKMKKDRVKTLHTLYTIEAEKNRIALNRLTHQDRSGPKRLNLAEEKARLVEELREVEGEENKLSVSMEEYKF